MGKLDFLLKSMLADSYELLAFDRQELDITNEFLVNKVVNDFKPNVIINQQQLTRLLIKQN